MNLTKLIKKNRNECFVVQSDVTNSLVAVTRALKCATRENAQRQVIVKTRKKSAVDVAERKRFVVFVLLKVISLFCYFGWININPWNYEMVILFLVVIRITSYKDYMRMSFP